MSEPLIGEPPWAQVRNLMEDNQRKDKRNAELEDENEKLRALLRDDRDCWARNDELEARIAKFELALNRICEAARSGNDWLARYAVDVSGKALEKDVE